MRLEGSFHQSRVKFLRLADDQRFLRRFSPARRDSTCRRQLIGERIDFLVFCGSLPVVDRGSEVSDQRTFDESPRTASSWRECQGGAMKAKLRIPRDFRVRHGCSGDSAKLVTG